MAHIFSFTGKRKSKTAKEYLEIFERLMASFEAFADKSKLFKKLVNELEITFFGEGLERTPADYCALIRGKIGRSLTKNEKIKIEVLVNAAKSTFIAAPTRKSNVMEALGQVIISKVHKEKAQGTAVDIRISKAKVISKDKVKGALRGKHLKD